MKNPRIIFTFVCLGLLAYMVNGLDTSDVFATEQTTPDQGPDVSKDTSAKSEAEGETASKTGKIAAATHVKSTTLYMPDGQLKSHTIRIYVSENIKHAQTPKLWLIRSHAVTKKTQDNKLKDKEPILVAPGQQWIESVEGVKVQRGGTILLFDLSQVDFGLRAMMRVLPVVSWMENGVKRITVGVNMVNVGNVISATSWTVLIVGMTLLVIFGLALKTGGNPLMLFAGADGHLSLAQSQVACWTIAVGGVVLGYGFIRFEIPTIPTSLLVLMGASLTTGGLGYFKDAQKQKSAPPSTKSKAGTVLSIGDLVRVFTAGQQPVMSLAKAQMLFWTILLLMLFLSKSILEGAIWDVPWSLVALMGFSQAGYLIPKLVPKS